MPIYPYSCSCGTKMDAINSVANRDNQKCPECGKVMKRLFHAQFGINMGPAGAHGYYDDDWGTYVETNRHHKELLREHGETPKGDTPKNEDAWV